MYLTPKFYNFFLINVENIATKCLFKYKLILILGIILIFNICDT